MFKRRLAVLGAVAVLAITGLAGSAMADETPSPAAGAKVTCTTSDGKTIEIAEALPAKLKDGKFVSPDGKVTRVQSGDAIKVQKLPEGETPEGFAKTKDFVKAEDGSAEALPALPTLPAEATGTAAPTEAVPAELGEPAEKVELSQKAEPGAEAPEGFAKTVKIICKKAE
ncbi:hypothetical protein GCM10022419_059270 [Nonomuraea rosea]|uniref:SH3 domain-containing protein n=1 Tax=Nonomuraea rosea TaxID=638574 RepID=A0ABP6XRH8_9ACTN